MSAENLTQFIPCEGRTVVVQIAEGEWRPAQIVKAWTTNPGGAVNLVVFFDGSNDDRRTVEHPRFQGREPGALMHWMTSVVMGTGIGQYMPRKPD